MKSNLIDDLLGESAGDVSPSDSILVPNLLPKVSMPYRIAIIGEAPGKDEVEQGKPFVGYSGRRLDEFLSRFGILRDACFIGNICQHRPPNNLISAFNWDGPEITKGLAVLKQQLSEWRPNVCLLLGGSALHAFMSPNIIPKKGSKGGESKFNFPNSISDWRGSFFEAHFDSPCPGVKCIASWHPAACLRQYEWTPQLMLDIGRCKKSAESPELILPKRDLLVDLSFERICSYCDEVLSAKGIIGTDIEGYWNDISCISFATSPGRAFIVPFTKMSGASLWSPEEEVVLWEKVAKILCDPSITKVWQNGLYDRFCLEYGYSIMVRNSKDIMLRHWELHCELEKSLAFQASIYTDEPYYKSERKTNDRETYWKYCCKDSCITLEIYEKLNRWLGSKAQEHVKFNEDLTNALLYMEKRGISYNSTGARSRLLEVEHHIYELQSKLDLLAGRNLPGLDKITLRGVLRDTMCYKRDPSRPKAEYKEDFDICMRILTSEGPLSDSEKGRLSEALGVSLNTKGKDLKLYLYDTLKLPVQYKESEFGKSVSTDYHSLITLRRKSSHPSLPLIIDIGELRTRAQMLRISSDGDGRVRAGYNEVGSETGRVTCYTSPTGSGYNLQTIPDENELKPLDHPLREGMRDLLVADTGCYLAKCDLKGADGWTVGANLASLGDRTMLDDLLFGLKPAAILCYAMRHGGTVAAIRGKSRQELLELCREVKKSDWDYFSAKQVIWGFCYLLGARTAANHVFNVSEGQAVVTEAQMEAAKFIVTQRYSLQLWWKATENRLYKQPYPPKLTGPSGNTREFFGRRQDIVGEALAHEPQQVTTYATNQAVYRCWTDPDNRTGDRRLPSSLEHPQPPNPLRPKGLRVEPLHQVHDEVLFQFRITDTEWAVGKIKSWFDNQIVIAGIPLTIPYEGAYGTDWSMNTKSKVGSI